MWFPCSWYGAAGVRRGQGGEVGSMSAQGDMGFGGGSVLYPRHLQGPENWVSRRRTEQLSHL